VKYLDTGLRSKLTGVLGDKTLHDTHTDIAITSCLVSDDDHPTGVLFTKTLNIANQYDNREELDLDQLYLPKGFDPSKMSLVDIALSTSAAPTYFPAHKIPAANGGKDHLFVDGGVVANNPDLFAHTEASQFVENPKSDILHLSLSTGYPQLKDG